MIIVKPVRINPWFKKNFTEYQVVRRTTRHFNDGYRDSDDYTVDSDEILYTSTLIEDAITIKNKMIEGGVV